jgi:C4-type Zn-finger protein
MTKVADANGHAIECMKRDQNFGLVVDDPVGYSKYMKEKKRIEDIENLKTDMNEVKGMLSEILRAINGKSNI